MTNTLATGGGSRGAALSGGACSVTSSPRWRSDRPPSVLLGEIRHWERILLTFTRPYFGTASSRSKTFAVSQVIGRLEQQLVDRLAPGLEIALELRAPAADVVGALERLHALIRAIARARRVAWRTIH